MTFNLVGCPRFLSKDGNKLFFLNILSSPFASALIGLTILGLVIGGILLVQFWATSNWLERGGECQIASNEYINNFIEDADRKGKKSEFLTWLVIVREKFGHANVKYGHLIWIYKQVKKKVPPSDKIEIPVFWQPY